MFEGTTFIAKQEAEPWNWGWHPYFMAMHFAWARMGDDAEAAGGEEAGLPYYDMASYWYHLTVGERYYPITKCYWRGEEGCTTWATTHRLVQGRLENCCQFCATQYDRETEEAS